MTMIIAKNTTATAKIMLSDGEMMIHITTDIPNISGGLTAIRMIIINAFCKLVTSVVKRVTKPAVENLSIFENEYV